MSVFKNKLTASLGLEDDAPNVQVNIDTDDMGMPLDNITDEGENTPEADEVEIIEDAAEIDADDDVADEMAEAADSLESIYLAMESAQADGGLTPAAAVFASIAVENIVSKYGATAKDVGVSLEAFGDNRSYATTVSMEGVGQALKDLWNTIVEKFQAMLKKIVDFYQKTIAAAPRIKRRAQAISKKARSTTGSAKESKIKTGLFASLNVRGKIPTTSEIMKGIENSTKALTTNVTKKDAEAAATALFGKFDQNATAETLGANLATDVGGTGLTGDATNGYRVAGGKTASYKIGGASGSMEFKRITDLPGNKMYFVGTVFEPKRINPIDAVRNMRVGVFVQDESYKADSKKERDMEWPVLGTGEIEGICDRVVQAMDAVIAQKTQADKKINGAKAIKKEGDKLIAKIEAIKGGEDVVAVKTRASKLLNNVVELTRVLNTGEAQLLSYNYRVSKAALAYCSRSLSQYKKD